MFSSAKKNAFKRLQNQIYVAFKRHNSLLPTLRFLSSSARTCQAFFEYSVLNIPVIILKEDLACNNQDENEWDQFLLLIHVITSLKFWYQKY